MLRSCLVVLWLLMSLCCLLMVVSVSLFYSLLSRGTWSPVGGANDNNNSNDDTNNGITNHNNSNSTGSNHNNSRSSNNDNGARRAVRGLLVCLYVI